MCARPTTKIESQPGNKALLRFKYYHQKAFIPLCFLLRARGQVQKTSLGADKRTLFFLRSHTHTARLVFQNSLSSALPEIFLYSLIQPLGMTHAPRSAQLNHQPCVCLNVCVCLGMHLCEGGQTSSVHVKYLTCNPFFLSFAASDPKLACPEHDGE